MLSRRTKPTTTTTTTPTTTTTDVFTIENTKTIPPTEAPGRYLLRNCTAKTYFSSNSTQSLLFIQVPGWVRTWKGQGLCFSLSMELQQQSKYWMNRWLNTRHAVWRNTSFDLSMISPHTLCPRAQIRCTMAVHLTQAWTSHLGVQLRCCLIFVQNCPYITLYVTGGGRGVSPIFYNITVLKGRKVIILFQLWIN